MQEGTVQEDSAEAAEAIATYECEAMADNKEIDNTMRTKASEQAIDEEVGKAIFAADVGTDLVGELGEIVVQTCRKKNKKKAPRMLERRREPRLS